MNSQQTRKLRGTKKEFPFGKSAIDNPSDWIFSSKPQVASAKKMDGTDVKPKTFKAKPVPRSHYVEPHPPLLFTNKKAKGRTTPVGKKMKKTLELTDPGLANYVWHLTVDPISNPDNGASAETVITIEPEKNESTVEVSPVAAQFQSEPAETVQDQPTAENHPGLASQMFNSMVDPNLLPTKQEPDEKSSAGNDAAEIPDEKQSDVQQEVEVDEDPQVSEDKGDTSETTDQKSEIASSPEDVEVSSDLPLTVEPRLETETESDLTRPQGSGPEKPEEPVRPGLQKCAVLEMGTIVGPLVDECSRLLNETSISTPEESAAITSHEKSSQKGSMSDGGVEDVIDKPGVE